MSMPSQPPWMSANTSAHCRRQSEGGLGVCPGQTRKSPARRIGTPIPGSRPGPTRNRDSVCGSLLWTCLGIKVWVDIVRKVRPIVRHLRVRVAILHRPVLGS